MNIPLGIMGDEGLYSIQTIPLDCIVEITTYCDHLTLLMLTSAEKCLQKYKPRTVISIDKLLLDVISTGSSSLYQYYDRPEMMPVWHPLLKSYATQAYLGSSIPVQGLMWILDRFKIYLSSIEYFYDILLIFANYKKRTIVCEYLENLVKENNIRQSKEHLIALSKCVTVDCNTSDHLFPAKTIRITKLAYIQEWSCWTGVNLDSIKYDSNRRSVFAGMDNVGRVLGGILSPNIADNLAKSILFGHTNYYINTYSAIYRQIPDTKIFRYHLMTAFEQGNTEIVKFLDKTELTGQIIWNLRNLNMAMIECTEKRIYNLAESKISLDATQLILGSDQLHALQYLLDKGVKVSD
jgi:hypothetical protein